MQVWKQYHIFTKLHILHGFLYKYYLFYNVARIGFCKNITQLLQYC